MENLEYYLDIQNNFLLAYERSSEFFVRYIEKTEEWESCSISFSNFRHDYAFKQISRQEAFNIANGNLPEAMLQQYLSMIRKNLGENA